MVNRNPKGTTIVDFLNSGSFEVKVRKNDFIVSNKNSRANMDISNEYTDNPTYDGTLSRLKQVVKSDVSARVTNNIDELLETFHSYVSSPGLIEALGVSGNSAGLEISVFGKQEIEAIGKVKYGFIFTHKYLEDNSMNIVFAVTEDGIKLYSDKGELDDLLYQDKVKRFLNIIEMVAQNKKYEDAFKNIYVTNYHTVSKSGKPSYNIYVGDSQISNTVSFKKQLGILIDSELFIGNTELIKLPRYISGSQIKDLAAKYSEARLYYKLKESGKNILLKNLDIKGQTPIYNYLVQSFNSMVL